MHTKLMQTGQVEKEKEHIRYNLIIPVILFNLRCTISVFSLCYIRDKNS